MSEPLQTEMFVDSKPATAPESLTDYDWIVVNSSAGKDSLAMLSLVCEQAKAAGVLYRVVVVHADLGRVEWQGTKELAQKQATHFGVRFEIVRHDRDLLQLVEARGMFPASRQRYCTSNLKTGQVHKLITRLADIARVVSSTSVRGWNPRPRILNCLGMRADESPARAKKRQFTPEDLAGSSSSRRRVDTWLPLHAWKEPEIWARIDGTGLREAGPVHRAYGLGMPRLSCCFCIFAPRAALMLAGKHNPGLLDEYVRIERKIGHTFRHNFAIADVQAALQAGGRPARPRHRHHFVRGGVALRPGAAPRTLLPRAGSARRGL